MMLKLRRCWCLALIPPWRRACWQHDARFDDDEPTGEILTMTDAQLLAAVRAQRRLQDDMSRAVDAAFEPQGENE